jgi:intracellular septation protein
MKLLADWAPLIVFFVAYKAADIYLATGLAIVASVVLMAAMRLKNMPIDKMQWISLGLIVVFGGATLLLQDERFIKAKPSLLYGIFAIALLGPQLFARVYLIEKLLASKVSLPGGVWGRLNAAWGLFFVAMAALNGWVAITFSTDIWVDFKVFGTLVLTVLFVVAQAVYMSRHATPESKDTSP